MNPDVLDLSRWNKVNNLNGLKPASIRGIIHKATQGSMFVDINYAGVRKAAAAAGLMFGAYHFADDSDVGAQVEHFLAIAQPDADTLLALDYEPNGNHTMSFAQAKEFLRLVHEKTGQMPVLYSGNLLKEQLRGKPDAFISQHRLWLAQYAATCKLPPGFDKHFLWQFSDRGSVPGIAGNVDLNAFGGSDLDIEWAPISVPAKAPGPQERLVIPAADPPSRLSEGMAHEDAITPDPRDKPEGKEAKAGVMATVTGALDTSDRNFAVLNELADKGSRAAQVVRKVKNWFWGAVASGGAASQLVDSKQGTASLFVRWVEAHPFLFAGVCASVFAVVLYCAFKVFERYLVTAYHDGRYTPRG